MRELERSLRSVYKVLEELGYRPLIVGTYALILQGWLPQSYLEETKDIDIYVDEPMIVFDSKVEEKIMKLGLSIGKSETGGIYVDAGKPIEIVYPIYDFYIPRKLLKHTMVIKGIRVLEGHAVLVAKALGGSIKYLAKTLRRTGVFISVERIRKLLLSVKDELDPSIYMVAKRRINEFIREWVGASREREEEVMPCEA